MDLPNPATEIARFSNSFVLLPERFFARQMPAQVAHPELIMFNQALAAELGLDTGAIAATGAAALFSGNVLPAGAEPIAMAYAGHQFGHFVPQLGDGRAILLGEVIDRAGMRRDIQLKGAGRTVFSRGGDGRAALGPVLREYLLSEAMHALGVPTTRALAAVTTGEDIFRERALPGAVLTRIAASHIRVGSFQYFAARGDDDGVRQLADHVIGRLYPALKAAENPYLALLEAVVDRQACLVAHWLQIGFIHGVMNTDNMAVSGETIDFGPCAFMDGYDPATVFSSIDHAGRYAYANQPRIAQWNLARLAETLLPFIDADEQRGVARAREILDGFSGKFNTAWLSGMRRKIGLTIAEAGDGALIDDLLERMARAQVDFTLLFRALGNSIGDGPDNARSLFKNPEDFDAWRGRWQARLASEPVEPGARAALMRQVNPVFIPRNHRVEAALAAAVTHADYGPFRELLQVLQQPFADQPEFAQYAQAPPPSDTAYRTFCGT